MNKVTREIAEQDFMSWFEAKKLPQFMLEKHADDKEAMISAIMTGNLVLNEDFTFTQKLNFPVKGSNMEVSELKYAFRISEGVLAASLRGIKTDDLIGQMPIAYISALTNEQKGTIRALDQIDSQLGKNIAAFFS